MNDQITFPAWLAQTILRGCLNLQETRFAFGKHNGKDHTDRSIPAPYIQWALENINNNRLIPPAFRRELEQELENRRSRGGRTNRPAAPAVPAAPTDVARRWFFAKIIRDGGEMKTGQYIALAKRDDGRSDFVVLSGQGNGIKNGIFSKEEVSQLVQAVKNGDQYITANSPEGLKDKVPDYQQQAAPQKAQTLNREDMSEEQKKIDERFERMMSESNASHMMINALAGTGKAQPLTSKILTSNGWKLMQDMAVGDKVFGSDGLSHSVLGVFPQGIKETYRMCFSDGSTVECCGEHLWFTETKYERDTCRAKKQPLFSRGSVRDTLELSNDLQYKGYPKHYIPLVSPVAFAAKSIPIDAYLLGVLLGDGSFRSGSITYSTADVEIVNGVDATVPIGLKSRYKGRYDYGITGGLAGKGKGKKNLLKESISDLGLWNHSSCDKFIPDIYKYNTIEIRIAVLQGLLDTDGSVGKRDGCYIEYSTSSERLCEDVRFLVESLGGTAKVVAREPKYTYKNETKIGKTSYRMCVKLPSFVSPFRLKRKLDRYCVNTKYFPRRSIVSIEPIGKQQCQCIAIDSTDHLYVTDNCVLTHNTTMLKHLAWKYGKPGQKWLYLVFNTKNRVEAEESFPREWVEVKTTNAFLGDLLKEQPNLAKIGQTDRINQRLQGGEGNGKLDKSRIMADGSGFAKVMKSVGLVDKLDCPHCHGALAKKKSGRYNITYCNACRSEMYERTGVSLMSLLKSITYNFKEATLTLVGLAKAYALDPRKPDKLKEGLEALLDDYDTIDTSLSEIKERINKYSGYFKDDIVHDLAQILGYNFMAKDFKEEIKTAATWMMNKTMPGGTDEKYKHRERDYNLGEMRDFVDDAWFPAIHADEIHWPKYDIVMADEVQDFNEARKIMLKKLAEAGAKVIAVGDPNQAIYRFIGADADAFNNLAKMLTDVSHDKDNVVHSISKNFRSRPKILEFSEGETHVKDLKSGKKWKEGEEGTVTNQEIAYDDAFGTIKQDNASGALKQKDTKGEFKQTAFIARTNEPLVHAALRLLGNGIPFIILGKDVTGDLLKHLKKVMAKFGITDDHDCSDLESRMNEFLDDQTEMFGNHATKRGYLQDLKESTEAILTTIQTCANEKGARTSIGQYKQWLQDRLGKHSFEVQDNEKDLKEYRKQMEEENPIVLTTAHKSKGLEFSRVYILRYDLFPHKKAKRPKDLAQEANMKYVAITRAKDELHILELDGQPGYKPTKSEE